jgi:hypothetical protein
MIFLEMEYTEKTYLSIIPSLKFQSWKVKVTLEWDMKAQKGSQGTVLLFL